MSAPQPISAGQPAPRFPFTEADGTLRDTAELLGRFFIVYFYPKDDTPGCTKEACGFRDSYVEFQELDIPVIGVSPDPGPSHLKFRNKHGLPFALASDEDHSIAEAFGVWGEKQFMGRRFDGIHRTTFIVDPHGRVAKIYPKVKPAEHAREILNDLPSLLSK